MSKHNFNSRQEVEAAILHRVAADPDFRKALLADPAKAIATTIGFELPTGMKLDVLEESARQVYLVIPPLAHAEMDLDELDLVAGGTQAPVASEGKATPKVLWGGQVGHKQVGGG